MDLRDNFERLISLRQRLGADLVEHKFGAQLDPFQKIVVQLETEGIVVEREDIQSVGPFLTYQGDVLAILYIFNSSNSKLELESEFPQERAPRFHFTWCKTLEDMTIKKRFARYVLSRSKSSLFSVEAKERDPDQITLLGECHVLSDIRLAPCKHCLDQLMYHGYSKRQSKSEKEMAVRNFSLQTYLDENDGTLSVMKFMPKHTDKTMPRGGYTSDFPSISTNLRAKAAWKCSGCKVDMSRMKKGLHVHHINGVTGDNSISNLQVLCALCHKNVDHFHANMHVFQDVERFILNNRR
jgi:5-methylcytosine-specific restriction endonuclease McrA